ncbi:hypothetical protein SANTM175S_02796 [Streptomyces antimycoticus]
MLLIVKVAPDTSSGVILLERTLPASSAVFLAIPAMLRSPAFLMTGVIRPFSASTAMPTFSTSK